MENSKPNYQDILTSRRRLVFNDLERHFNGLEAAIAEEALASICRVSFTDGIVVESLLDSEGQYNFTVGLPNPDSYLYPMWTLSTGIRTSITVFAPTEATKREYFYDALLEHMFNVPATDQLMEWWSSPVHELHTRVTIDFDETALGLCEVVIDLCAATLGVADISDIDDELH